MALESVSLRLAAQPEGASKEQLRILLASFVDGIQALCAKLDADVGVTDTNYAAIFATFIRD